MTSHLALVHLKGEQIRIEHVNHDALKFIVSAGIHLLINCVLCRVQGEAQSALPGCFSEQQWPFEVM